MLTLDKLVNTALLGTERQPFALLKIFEEDNASKLLKRLNPGEERSLLRGAAICDTYTRAGRLPQSFSGTLPMPALAELKREVSGEAAAILDRMLKGQYPEFLPLWLSLAANAGRMAPGHYLPLLLDIAAGSKRQRPAIAAVMGSRGAWLTEQNPKWKAMVAGNPDWNSDNKEHRLEYFQNLHQCDPFAARELLQKSWKEHGGPERAELVQILNANVSMEDHDLLESLLDEKRADIRQAAADVLLSLPESHLVRRMIERSRAIFRLHKSRSSRTQVEISLPAECDAGMQRDGINPKLTKAGWLGHIVEKTPLHFWWNEFGMDPDQILKVLVNADFSTEVISALVRAATREGNEDWGRAIFNNKDFQTGINMPDLGNLISSLKKEVREQIACHVARSNGSHGWWFVVQLPTPWGDEASIIALEAVLIGKPDLIVVERGYVKRLAEGISTNIADQVLNALKGVRETSPAVKELNDFLARYTFRIQLEKEFSL